MCNNNFSNRSKKGGLLSSDNASKNKQLIDDSPQAGNAQIVIQFDMIGDSDTLLISVTTWRNTGEESTIVENTGDNGNDAVLKTTATPIIFFLKCLLLICFVCFVFCQFEIAVLQMTCQRNGLLLFKYVKWMIKMIRMRIRYFNIRKVSGRV